MKEKLKIMKIGGAKLVKILTVLEQMAEPGVNLLDIERKAWFLIEKSGGKPSFAQVLGYNQATCLNVNDGLVHGLPKDYQLKEGDLLNIDIGFFYKGFHTDLAKSLIVAQQARKWHAKGDFLKIGERALDEAIKLAVTGNFVGTISAKIQKMIEGAGYHCSWSYTGHGIGKKLHQPPVIPCILVNKIEQTFRLATGMTLAIEVIYMRGTGETKVDKDGWTVRSADGSWASCFEKTVAVGKKEATVLTPW